jgi:hypothetical protein
MNGMSYTTNQVSFEGFVSGVSSKSQIVITQNGNSTPFNYDSRTNKFSGSLNLANGSNTLLATVTNQCGSVNQSVSVTYSKPCPAPTVSISSPNNGNSITSGTIQISGVANNLNTQTDLILRVNGNAVNFNYNSTTKVFTATANAQSGNNTITATAATNCGTDSKTISVTFIQPCKSPFISFFTPRNGSRLSSSSTLVKGTIIGIKSSSQIDMRVNGRRVAANYIPSSTEFNATISLRSGKNTISISVENDCGADSKSIQVDYTPPCPKPTVRILTPKNNLSVKGNKITVTGIATNLLDASDIEIKVNGVSQPVNYSFSTKSFTATVTLTSGARNAILATVATNCGTDMKSVGVSSILMQKPTVRVEYPSMDTSSTPVTQSKLFGSVTGITGASKFEIRINGTKITSYTLTSQGSERYSFNGLMTLSNGLNVITIKATHSSGGVETKTKVITVTSNNNIAPKVERNDKTRGGISPVRNSPTRSPNRR